MTQDDSPLNMGFFKEKAKIMLSADYKSLFALLSMTEMSHWTSVPILGHCKQTETKENQFRRNQHEALMMCKDVLRSKTGKKYSTYVHLTDKGQQSPNTQDIALKEGV